MATATTYWRTIRHLRWSQLGFLALRRVLPRSNSPARIKAPVRLRPIAGPWPFLEWQPETSRRMIASREFTFLSRSVAGRDAVPWNDRRLEKLWLYHLNYFDFLNVDLTRPEDELALGEALSLALEWCASNWQGSEVGWEPYPLSLRIVNWLKFLARHGRRLEEMENGGRVGALLASLAVQVARLEHRLEKDLLGNHLLKNIKALLFAGALLESPRSARWWRTGEELLAGQLSEQILADGGHYERSPMYHAQVLEDLAEIRLLCRATGRTLAGADLLPQKVEAMAQFLAGILHPDGEIPFFNDSALDGARPPAALLAMAGSADAREARNDSPVAVFPHTGYAVIRNREAGSALIFDCGPLGPDYQPGHGHCDVLSYELSLRGQRVVVNPGVSTYEPGRERAYERSTAAHNTLRVDNAEQAETWASFRVGRRPRAGPLRSGAHWDFLIVSGEHDAFQRLGVVHARIILWRAPDTWMVIDWLEGSGTHQVEAFLHFHPRVRFFEPTGIVESGGRPLLPRWRVELAQPPYVLAAYGAGRLDWLEGRHAERFGDLQASRALRWTWQEALPTGMIHLFAPAGSSLPPIAADWKGKWVEIDGHKIPLNRP